jgi:thiaminase/transcriptional activator TenA
MRMNNKEASGSMQNRVTDQLYESARMIWRACEQHPFVTGLGDGTLPVEKFRFYICQDYVYLVDYSKLFAWAVIKSPTLELAGRFADLLHSTIHQEMDLHRRYAERFGISASDLEKTEPAPITIAYTRYLLEAASQGDLGELLAALLPCAWLYWEVGSRLAARASMTGGSPYREWIDTYSDPRFGELTQWLKATLDQLAEGLPDWYLKRLRERFVTASRFEYLFWDMAYREATWPV